MLSKPFNRLLAATTLCFFPLMSAEAVTVTANGGPGQPNFVLPSNLPVPSGNHVQIGYFSDGFDPATNARNPGLLASAWNPFGSLFTMAIEGEQGRIGGSVSMINDQFDNQKIYLWAFDTTDDMSAPNMSLSNVENYGLFSSTADNWAFPSEGDPSTSTLVSLSEVDQFFYGSSGGGSLGSLRLGAIPEPSSTMLLVVALAMGISVRRR